MSDDLLQFALSFFAIGAVLMAMSRNDTARKWAPVVGLAGQPFWIVFAIRTQAWGVLVLAGVFTLVYLSGLLIQWRPQGVKP
jgi:hypothetical protein